MKLGVFNPILGNLPFEAMLDTLQALGVEAIEIASGGYVGDAMQTRRTAARRGGAGAF